MAAERPQHGALNRLYLNRNFGLLGGAVATLLMATITLVVGFVSGREAEMLLEAVMPTARFLCSSTATAAATTLALMLTILGLSASVSHSLKDAHYRRIKQIALIDSVAFILAMILLLTLVIPFGESGDIPGAWYTGIYYFVVAGSAILGGIMVAVILMIYGAVRDMADVFLSGIESRLVADEPEEE